MDRAGVVNTYQKEIEALAQLDFNYDEKLYHESADKSGWVVDHYHAQIGQEAPGDPLPNGPFAAAKDAIRLYKFPEPRLIHAVFDADADLPGRNMLMFAKFAGVTFTFGVRITAVIDEVRLVKGTPTKVWGYAYRTLKGHFEVGEIRFEVSKNLLSGELFFEVDAYSKPERIPNLFYRIGFKLFGRSLQKYFANSSIRRLRAIANSQRT